jgi:glycerol-3-phosphate dehydrogenase
VGRVIVRDPAAASGSAYDLVVVGGGAYGVCVTLEAARRGLRPLLLERGDFGGETSWNSLRIVHGGLRYLQSLDLHRFRESVGERGWFLRNFPDLVEPIPCLMPLYGEGLRRPPVLRAALLANDVLTRTRNCGVPPERHLAPGRVLAPDEVRRAFPGVRPERLRGAALWHDAAMPDSQRLLIELLRAAVAAGARALNYVPAEEVLVEGGHVVGVAARDAESGTGVRFSCPVVVNCAGPWSREFAARADRDIPELFRPSLAFNVLLDRPPVAAPAVAVAPPRPGARTYFLTGWKGRLFAGTDHQPMPSGAAPAPPTTAQVERLLADLNESIPGLGLAASDVLRVHWGALPAASDGTDVLAVREAFHDHGHTGGPRGLFSISGVKWTTARLVAENTVERVFPGRPAAPFSRAVGSLPPGFAEFRALAARDRDAARRLVARLVSEECVRRPEDLFLRRTDWGSLPADADEARRLVESVAGEGFLAQGLRR